MCEEEEHPLFMDKMPEHPEDNPILASLQNLLYEGPPDEVATGFKTLGNQQMALKTKRGYVEAIKFYSQGLDVQAMSTSLRVVLLGNRAQAQLELKNYGHALKDSKAALELTPTDMKAYLLPRNWRAGKASFSLGKFADAISYFQTALVNGGDSSIIPPLITQCEMGINKADKPRAPVTDISQVLSSRGIRLRKLEVELPYPFSVSLGEDDILRFPIIFLYDQPMHSDYIEAMREDETFLSRLQEVLPPPWDDSQLFTLSSTRLFYQKKPGYGEVALTDTLGSVVIRRDYVMPQVPVFHLVSTKTEYIREFLD